MAKEYEKCELAVEVDRCPDAMFLCRELGRWTNGEDEGEVLMTGVGIAIRYKGDQYHITFGKLATAVANHVDGLCTNRK